MNWREKNIYFYPQELTQEFEWWLEKRSVTFKFNNETVRMFRYYQDNQTPRPEGFK